MCIIGLNNMIIHQKKLQELFSSYHNRMSIPFQLRLAPRLMNHGTSLPHRPALSLNLRDIFKILQATEKKKKRENNATTKQLSPRELATDTAVSLIQQGFRCHFEVHTRKSRTLCTGYLLSLHSSHNSRHLSWLHLIHLRLHATFSWDFRHFHV